jgi:ubiquinone/menaquinone biosynthesis C-methylase UbiE
MQAREVTIFSPFPGDPPEGGEPPSPPSAESDRIAAYFDAQAQFWDEMYGRRDVLGLVHQLRQTMALAWVDAIGLPADALVLELGCGNGSTSVALASRGLRVVASDVSDAMIARTRGRVADAGVEALVTVEQLDAQSVTYPDRTFSLVLALGVLPWAESPVEALNEMVRVLRPGGFLVANVSNPWRLTFLADPLHNPVLRPLRSLTKAAARRVGRAIGRRRGPGPKQESPWAFNRELRSRGLAIERSSTFGYGPFTFLDHEFLPNAAAASLHLALQGLSDRGFPLLRWVGAQYLVLGRRPSV